MASHSSHGVGPTSPVAGRSRVIARARGRGRKRARSPHRRAIVRKTHSSRPRSTWHSRTDTQALASSAVATGRRWRIVHGIHPLARQLFQLLLPFPLRPRCTAFGENQIHHVENLQVAVSSVFWHGEHERSRVQDTRDQAPRTAVQAKSIPSREHKSEQHLEPIDGRGHFGHNEDEAFGR